MAGSAGAASTTGMFQMDIEIQRNIENRTRLSVVAVGELAGFEFNRLLLRKESEFGHNSIVRSGASGILGAMFQQMEANLIRAVEQAVRALGSDIKVTLEQPKQTSFGELAIPVAFQLARQLKRPPQSIAQEIVGRMPKLEGIAAYEIAGNGYINVRLDRGSYAASLLSIAEIPSAASAEKFIVEH